MVGTQVSIHAFLEALAARTPTPGGGASAALVGATGAAQARMVVRYSLARKGLEAHQPLLVESDAAFERAVQAFESLVIEDQQAYKAMADAKKALPGALSTADATLLAVQVPQTIAVVAIECLRACESLAGKVNPFLESDRLVAMHLFRACARAAAESVRANLKSLPPDALARTQDWLDLQQEVLSRG